MNLPQAASLREVQAVRVETGDGTQMVEVAQSHQIGKDGTIRFRATGNLNQWYNAIALGFGGTEEGIDSTGYSVAYIPAWGKLKLTREYKFLDYASVTLIPGQWYQLKVVRNGATGSIEVYLDQGQGYPETPTLEAVDSTYPDLRRLGWAAGGSGYALEVEWIIAVEGGAP